MNKYKQVEIFIDFWEDKKNGSLSVEYDYFNIFSQICYIYI